MNPEWDEVDSLDMDENALCIGNPFIVSWFEIKEEYRKKRLDHVLPHIALQSSDCEGYLIFFCPLQILNMRGLISWLSYVSMLIKGTTLLTTHASPADPIATAVIVSPRIGRRDLVNRGSF